MLHPKFVDKYTRGTGGNLAQRQLLVSGNEALDTLRLPPTVVPDAQMMKMIAERAADALNRGQPLVEPNFLPQATLNAARSAAAACIEGQAAASSGPLLSVISIVDALRKALAGSTNRALASTCELQLVAYAAGGSYQRHVDWKPGMLIGPEGCTSVKRSISLLLYLTPDDWNPAADGGALRVYDGASAHMDVQALPGQLVLFDSSRIAHEVLTTRRDRMLVAGWLHEEFRG